MAATPSTTRIDESGGANRRAVDLRTLIALAAIGLLLVLMAIPRIVSGAFILAYEPVIRLIQHNGEVPIDRLLAAQSAYESAIAWHAGAEERSTLASLRRRSGLMLGADSAVGRGFLESARQAERDALATTPTNPYLWAQLAQSERILDGPTPRFTAALMRSIATGPFEPTLLTFRAALGLENWTALSSEEKKLVADQVRAAALLQPAWLRRAINDPLRLRLVLEILETEPQLYAGFRGGSDSSIAAQSSARPDPIRPPEAAAKSR
jgi:hypothetical protein